MADLDQAAFNNAPSTANPPAGLDQDAFNAAPKGIVPETQPAAALPQIGSAAARGVLVDLPKMTGQALQYASSPGNSLYQAGAGMVASADARGQASWLTPNLEGQGAITKGLASGAEMLGAGLPAIGATVLGGAAAAAAGIPAAIGVGFGAAAGAALGAGQAGQQTLEAAQAKGLSPDAALTAARLNAGVNFAAQTAVGALGGRLLGAAGSSIGKAVGIEAEPLAAQVMNQLTGTNALSGFAKQAVTSTAEIAGVNAVAAGAGTAINNATGVGDGDSAWDAALQTLPASLGMGALLTPLGLASRAIAARTAGQRTAVLSDPTTSPEIRTQLADQYATQLAKDGSPASQQAAATFRANAETAIRTKQELPVSAGLFTENAITPPTSTETPLLENNPSTIPVTPSGEGLATVDQRNAYQNPEGTANLDVGATGLGRNSEIIPPETAPAVAAPLQLGNEPAHAPVTFPDGSVSRSQGDVDSYVGQFPEDQQGIVRNRLQGADTVDTTATNVRGDLPTAPTDLRLPAPPEAPDFVADAAGNTGRTQAEALAARQSSTDLVADASGNVGRTQEDVVAARAQQQADADLAAGGPKKADAIASDVADVNAANDFSTKPQSLVPFNKRLDALGINDAATHQDQIDLLQKAVDDPKSTASQAIQDRMAALLAKWKGDSNVDDSAVRDSAVDRPAEVASEPVSEAAQRVDALSTPAPAPEALGQNIPVSAPDNTAAPAGVEAAAAALPDNTSGTALSRVPEVATKVDTALGQLTDKQASGGLTKLETERMEDLQSYKQALAKVTAGHDEGYVKDITELAENAASKPYRKTFRQLRTSNPDTLDRGLMMDAVTNGRLDRTLGTIAEQGSTPAVRAMAEKLAPFVGDTPISYTGVDHPLGVGEYTREAGVGIYRGGESESTVLHEASHAAQEAQITRAEQIVNPRNQRELELKNALGQIDSIRQQAAARDTASQYGLTDNHEFLAELNSNPDFQKFLGSADANKQSLWQKAVAAVKSLFGMKGQDGTFLERAMKLSDTFYKQAEDSEAGFPLKQTSPLYKKFNDSPAGAASVMDERFGKLGGLADNLKIPDVNKLSTKLFGSLMGMKTVQYISDRVRAIPEFRASGFAKAVDAYYGAINAHRAAVIAIEHPFKQFESNTLKVIRAAGDVNKQRELSGRMATLSGEASRMGIDTSLNARDNRANGWNGPRESDAYVNQLHRDHMQLKASNPDAITAMQNGQKIGQKQLVTGMATSLRATLDSTRGRADQINANLVKAKNDLAALQPTDPKYAAAKAALDGATAESGFLAKHYSGLDFSAKSLDSAKNSNPAKYFDGRDSTLASRLESAFADANTLPDSSPLKAHMDTLAEMYHAQSGNPYFSLGRSGDHFVKIQFKPGMDEATVAKMQAALKGTNKVLGDPSVEDHAFFRVDTADQAYGLHRKLIDAGGQFVDASKSARGPLYEGNTVSANGVTPALRNLLSSLHDTVDAMGLTGDAAEGARASLTRSLLSMLPETSSRSAKLQRQGIAGYDSDFLGNLSKRSTGAIQDIAHGHTQKLYSDAMAGMKQSVEQMNRTGSQYASERGTIVANELNKRLANSQKAVPNTLVNTINSLGHTFYLAASPAYLIRTTAQPFHRALPLLGSRYGFVNSAKEIAGATGTAIKIAARTIGEGYKSDGLKGVLSADANFRNMGLKPNEEAFIQELHDRGELNLGQGRQLQQMELSGSQTKQDLTRMAGMTAQYAEMTNRLATALAAFRLAEKSNNKGGDAAKSLANTEYAIDSAKKTMDDFDPGNTARLIGKHGFAGSVTPLFTAFMNYNLQTMQQIARTVHDGFFNKDQTPAGIQRASESKKEFAGLLATTGMISGALGLPFVNAFAGVYNTLMNDNDDPHDIRIDVQNWLARNIGQTGADVVSHGIPRSWGFDTSTFGLENLLPGSDFLSSRALFKDRLDELQQNAAGPALSGAVNIAQGVSKISDGYISKGVEALLPSGLKPYFKAYELSQHGYTDGKGNPSALGKATGWDVGLQALGFSSAKRATQLEAQEFSMDRDARQTLAKQQVGDTLYKGINNNDPAQIQSAVQHYAAYNRANPTMPIGDIVQPAIQKLTALATSQALGLGVNATVKQYPSLAQSLLFAANQDNR